MTQLRFTPEAMAEFASTVRWYAERSMPAARALTTAIEAALESIRRFPQAWPVLEPGSHVRVRKLPQHRHSIIYQLHDDELLIVAITHQRRLPGYWHGRI